MDLSNWTARPRPERVTLQGRYCRLEALEARHAASLFTASSTADIDARFAYLFDQPPASVQHMEAWIAGFQTTSDPLMFALIDAPSGAVAGRQALMRIDPAHGVLEIGHIYWGPLAARKRPATESIYLLLRYAFDTLGYRRVEWKCHGMNTPSRKAALRFGFQYEGLFRNHMVMKGENRDTAWFAITLEDWQSLRPAYEAWLSPENFDSDGQQRQSLQALIA